MLGEESGLIVKGVALLAIDVHRSFAPYAFIENDGVGFYLKEPLDNSLPGQREELKFKTSGRDDSIRQMLRAVFIRICERGYAGAEPIAPLSDFGFEVDANGLFQPATAQAESYFTRSASRKAQHKPWSVPTWDDMHVDEDFRCTYEDALCELGVAGWDKVDMSTGDNFLTGETLIDDVGVGKLHDRLRDESWLTRS